MEAVLTKLIEQLNSSVFILLVILGVAFWGTYKVFRLIEQFVHHKGKVDKLEGLSEKIIVLATKVDLIYSNTNPNKLVAAQSPIAITPAGKEIALKINAEAIFQRHVRNLAAFVEEGSPKTAYDIQVRSMLASKEKLMTLLNAEEINLIKAEAFKRGLIVEDILGIFGVLLRDHVLAAKGMPVSEVDRNPPA